MGSLVAVVVLIFLSVLVSGPIALALAAVRAHPIIVVPVSLLAILVGAWWATTVIMPAALTGLIPIACGVAAIRKSMNSSKG